MKFPIGELAIVENGIKITTHLYGQCVQTLSKADSKVTGLKFAFSNTLSFLCKGVI